MTTLRIAAIQARAVVVPMRRALRTSTGVVEQAPLLLIDLRTDGGPTGRSYLFGVQPFTLAPVRALVESFGSWVAGDALVPLEIERKLRGRLTLPGPVGLAAMALAGIDMAVWDALARSRDVPLATLLGGSPGPVAAYNSNGLGIMPADGAAAEAAVGGGGSGGHARGAPGHRAGRGAHGGLQPVPVGQRGPGAGRDAGRRGAGVDRGAGAGGRPFGLRPRGRGPGHAGPDR